MPSPVLLQRLVVLGPDDDVTHLPLFWRGRASAGRGAGGLAVTGGDTVDLGTWQNAAPFGWWARLGISAVRLTVRGRGSLVVRSSRGGDRGEVARADLSVDEPWTLDVPTADVDWCWLEVAAGPDGARLDTADWTTERDVAVRPLTVVVPTYRAEDDALAQVARLAAPALADVVGRVVLIDQGGTLGAHPGAAEALAAAGERVLLVEQPNLGGSGGYSRGLLEASDRWPEDPVFLHDDDARVPAETLRRLTVLAALAPGTFFGTGLLDADAPTRLQALAEGVARRPFRWGPADGIREGEPVDVGPGTPDTWTFTGPDDHAGYGAWWGCLVPGGASRRLGLAAPFFLKWDDAEYGLRAGRAGFGFRTLPGFSVHHPTWATKGTSAAWSSWPMHRNRLATAAAYGAGRGVLLDSFLHQVKHVLSLQYATAELWNAALAETIGGPGWLEGDLTAVRPRAQALLDAVPPARVPDRVRAGRALRLPSAAQFDWRAGLCHDVVVFDDGAPALVRDHRRALRALVRTVALHAGATVRWRVLRARYAAALGPASSRSAWERRIAGAHPQAV